MRAAVSPRPATPATPATRDPETLDADSVELAPTVVGRPAPAWLKALELWHSASTHPVALLVDGMVVAYCFRHLGTTRPAALAAGGAFALLSTLFGLAAHRTTVQSQGVRWYLKPLAVVCFVMTLLIGLFHPLGLTPVAVTALTQAATLLILGRWLGWKVIAAARHRDLGLRPALVIGTNARVNEFAAELAACKEVGLRFAAGYSPTLPDTEAVADGHAQAFSLLEHDEIDHILLVNDGIDESVFREFVTWVDDRRGYTLVLPLIDLVRQGSKYHIGRFPVVPLPIGVSRNRLIAKRTVDIVVGAVLAVLALPAIILLALAVCVSLGTWHPFFYQERVGRAGRRFTLPKLRTLPTHAPESAAKYAIAGVEITAFGRFLRNSHLDELPQLLLVPFGRMSLVGPRPEMPWLLASFDPDFVAARSQLRPGCTGLWQIGMGAHKLIGEAPEYDLCYLQHMNLRLDLWILARSVLVMGGGTLLASPALPGWTQRSRPVPVARHAPAHIAE